MPVRRSGAITHGAAAISFTARSIKAATMIHGNTAHRYLADLEAGLPKRDTFDREALRAISILELTVTPGIADPGRNAAALQSQGCIGLGVLGDRGGRI